MRCPSTGGYALPGSSHPGAQALPAPRRSEPWCPEGKEEWKLHHRRVDPGGHCRTALAAGAGEALYGKGTGNLSQPDDRALLAPPNEAKPAAPVRVKLKRINAHLAKAYPPNGEGRAWWARLKAALGTTSSDFVNASLFQLQTAAQLPCSGISAIAMNAALAFIEGTKPRNEMEAALAMQMACTHAANMIVLGRLQGGAGGERRVVAIANASARLSQAFASQVEAYRRLKNGASQFVRVEHVHVNEGGQAIIGNISPPGCRKEKR
jgi:hypothetical protein